MLEGRFGESTGRPYIEGRLLIPRLRIIGDISFIFDTGADMTVLMPLDADRLGVNYGDLSNTVDTTGIGGISTDFVEPSLIVFTDPGVSLHMYSIDLYISTPSPDIATIPSLLGRNVLDHWTVLYDKPNGRLSAEVVYADFSQSLSASSQP